MPFETCVGLFVLNRILVTNKEEFLCVCLVVVDCRLKINLIRQDEKLSTAILLMLG